VTRACPKEAVLRADEDQQALAALGRRLRQEEL
jgi:hypothetical protein